MLDSCEHVRLSIMRKATFYLNIKYLFMYVAEFFDGCLDHCYLQAEQANIDESVIDFFALSFSFKGFFLHKQSLC